MTHVYSSLQWSQCDNYRSRWVTDFPIYVYVPFAPNYDATVENQYFCPILKGLGRRYDNHCQFVGGRELPLKSH